VTGEGQLGRKSRSAFFAFLPKDTKSDTTDTGFAFGVLIFLTRIFAYNKKPASIGKRAFRFI